MVPLYPTNFWALRGVGDVITAKLGGRFTAGNATSAPVSEAPPVKSARLASNDSLQAQPTLKWSRTMLDKDSESYHPEYLQDAQSQHFGMTPTPVSKVPSTEVAGDPSPVASPHGRVNMPPSLGVRTPIPKKTPSVKSTKFDKYYHQTLVCNIIADKHFCCP